MIFASSKLDRIKHRLLCAIHLIALAFLCLFAALTGPSDAQEPELSATAIFEREGDYGRMKLEFDELLELPPYEISAENGVLRIVFEEPVETDISDAMRVLSDFVTVARQDPDGRALRFGLSRAVRVNTMEAGELLFVDFLPPTWQGFPPPLPEEVIQSLAARAEQAALEAAEAERRRLLGELEPEVSLRVGRAPTFTRYSFEWNVPFNVEITQAGAELTMVFDFDVPIDLTPALVDRADELEAIEFDRNGASLSVVMTVVPGAGLRWFEQDRMFVVDLDREVPLQPEGIDQAEIDNLLSTLVPGRPAVDGDGDATRFSSAASRPDDVVVPDPVDPVADQSRELDPNALQSAEDAEDSEGQNQVAEVPDDQDASPAATLTEQNDGNMEALAQRPDVASAPTLQTGRAPEVGVSTTEDSGADVVRVTVRTDEQGARLIFPFPQETAAAAFGRESFITLVFESAIPFDLRSLRFELNDMVRSIRPVRVNDLNIIHLELREETLVSMAPSGTRWVVNLGPSVLEPPTALDISRGIFADGTAYAEILAGGLGTIRRIVHPHVGDELYVVPMMPPTHGALARQEFVEFELLPSAQGIVIRPKTEELSIALEEQRVLITRDSGLSLSEVGLPLGSFGFDPDDRPGYFDLRAYKGEGPSEFKERMEEYQTRIAASEGTVRVERLLDFSRFLMAFELGQEANGLLDVAVAEAPSLEHDEVYLTLRAAALTLADRYEEAKAIVDSHAMGDVSDAAFWGLLADAALRNWPEVNNAFDDVSVLFSDYPAQLVARARLDGVEAAIQVQSVDLAVERLSQVHPAPLRGRLQEGRLELLQARVDLAKGRIDQAVQTFDQIRQMDLGPHGAEATLRSIEARILGDLLSPEDGVEELENLAVAWRGDDTEVSTRVLLGELYVEQGRYGDALTAMKGILIAQPGHKSAAEVSEEMQDIFVDLFLNGEADRLAAIDALALFYDFRELTPIGRRGDELVRRMADRLVSVDLLDQAAQLLEHQVEHRLSGTARAQIAADLALIYLMDYRPAQAVSVLQRSRASQVPPIIERGRRVIEARALSELGRHELALEILRQLQGIDVAAVRADVLWNAERWLDAGEVIERSLADRWLDRIPLDEQEMQQVLRAAIAFSFAGDSYALERLRARYESKMSMGIYASAFDVVTAPIETHGSAFRDVARSIAGLSTLNRFLDDYRARFSSQPVPNGQPGA